MQEIPSLFDFVLQIAGGGFVAVIIAFALEHIGPFQKLQPEAKKWVVLGFYIVLPLGATAAVQFVPADVWLLLEPYWRALALGFLGWVGSQMAHTWDKGRQIRSQPYSGAVESFRSEDAHRPRSGRG